jgi:uncharacterized protein with GYD domain
LSVVPHKRVRHPPVGAAATGSADVEKSKCVTARSSFLPEEKLGGRLLSMYYMAGDSDGFIIYEAPDAKAAATVSIAAGLAGHIRSLKTSQLYTVAETMEVMGSAGKLAFPAPKG